MAVDLSHNIRFTRTDVTAVKLHKEYVLAGLVVFMKSKYYYNVIF